jgi:hypothetical protein
MTKSRGREDILTRYSSLDHVLYIVYASMYGSRLHDKTHGFMAGN